uniref:uracil-DNA glycosylase n=1 Tax=Ciona intestinalis TaxID=7719 RepID=UPI000180BE6E|nr:uracil-DNA glycosylase [Ciona intestinalis]|eukprot:XP_018667776.1 uracil-DNA glycosylase [Ciona intestinalis]
MLLCMRVMPSQKKISTFFSPKTTNKRKTTTTNETSKKLKADKENINITETQRTNTTKQVCLDTPKNKMGPSWRIALQAELTKPYYIKVTDFVKSERTKHKVYPPEQQVFAWTQHCKIEDIKVVILGQDPYHGPGQAHGLCFSVQKGIRTPPSLKNMFKELESDVEGFNTPDHGDLTGWADQGVLLLNAVLTVRDGEPNSHKDKGWEELTDSVISWISTNLNGVVFMLWGSYAHKKGAKIDQQRHLVLKAVHPSPLSAHRGYFGCKHFSKANKYLKKQGKSEIEWNDL